MIYTIRSFDLLLAQNSPLVMPALVAGIHDFLLHSMASKTWMAGTSPAMTMWRVIAQAQRFAFALESQIKLLDQIVVVELLG